jgi:hypothetical protein
MRKLACCLLVGALGGCSLVRNLDDLDAGSAAPPSHRPPPPPEQAGPGDGPGHTFAITKLLLGTKDRFGEVDIDAWESLGYDLDGLDTITPGAGHCLTDPSASVLDGRDGIDNQFGWQIIWQLLFVDISFEDDVAAALDSGAFTMLLQLDALGDQPNYLGLGARMLVATESAITTAGTEWTPAAEAPLLEVGDAYVNGNVFVATSTQPLRLVLMRPPSRLVVEVQRPIVTMELSPDRTSAVNGVIAGVVEVEGMVVGFRELVANVPLPCDIAEDVTEIRRSVDIMADGSQDPSSMCTALSLGIGFEAVAVTTGGTGMPLPALAGICPE